MFVTYNVLADALTGNEAGFSSETEDLAFENRAGKLLKKIFSNVETFGIFSWGLTLHFPDCAGVAQMSEVAYRPHPRRCTEGCANNIEEVR